MDIVKPWPKSKLRLNHIRGSFGVITTAEILLDT